MRQGHTSVYYGQIHTIPISYGSNFVPAEWIRIWIRAFGDSVENKMANGHDDVAVRNGHTTCAEPCTIIGQVTRV